jgi:hypothetical protein
MCEGADEDKTEKPNGKMGLAATKEWLADSILLGPAISSQVSEFKSREQFRVIEQRGLEASSLYWFGVWMP